MGMRPIVVVIAALALAACGSTREAGPTTGTPTASASASTGHSDPTRLVGSWVVSDAAGAEPGTVLRIGDNLSLWQTCGFLMGSWRANGSLFVGHLDGGDGACIPKDGRPTPAWLAKASGYSVSGDAVALLASDGSVVARLTPGGKPTPGPNIASSLAEPPVLDARLKASLTKPPTPLPSSLRPATRAQLVGAWYAAVPRPSTGLNHDTEPGITFAADGSYRATDGCNGTDGRWASNDAGALIVASGPSTLIGCDNVDVAGWATRAAWAAFDGTTLVLVAPDGARLGRLTRA